MTGSLLDLLSEGTRYAIGVGTGAGGGVSDTDDSGDSSVVDVMSSSWVLDILFEGESTRPGKHMVFGEESMLADAISGYMHVKTKY